MKPSPAKSLSGLRKASILLVLMGDDIASAIYQQLPQEEVQKLTQEILELEYISPEVAAAVLNEYYQLSVTQDYLAQGGPDYASRLLKRAFGDDGARDLLDHVMQAQEAGAGNFDYLQKADPEQLAKFVEAEHPLTIALVLAHLGTKPASTLLMMLPEKIRAKAVERLAKIRQFSPEVVQKISVVLHRKLSALGDQSRRAYGGVKAVSELLNRLDPNAQKLVLETIEQEDPKLTIAIRDLMFTFEDLVSVPENSVRELLAQVDKKVLAMALKGASDQVKTHVFRAMSSRAVEMLQEDMDVLGPVRSRDILHAQQETVAVARKLEAEGKLILKSDRDEELVV